MTQQAPGPYVFVAGQHADAYHQSEDCPALKEVCKRVPAASVRDHRDKCKVCYSRDDIDTGGRESVRCPRCGNSVRSLAFHLPHCDGGGSDD